MHHEISQSLITGMTTYEVKDLMGQESSIDAHTESKSMVLRYCRTGWGVDGMTYVWIQDGRLRQVLNEKSKHAGKCERFFRSVDWDASLGLDYLVLKVIEVRPRNVLRVAPVVSNQPVIVSPPVIEAPDLSNDGEGISRAWQMLNGKGSTGSKAWDLLLK